MDSLSGSRQLLDHSLIADYAALISMDQILDLSVAAAHSLRNTHLRHQSDGTGRAWYMGLPGGSVNLGVKPHAYYVWPVRGGQS